MSLSLNNSKINCPKPQKNKNGSYLIKLKDKTACIVSFLEGKDKKLLNLKNCHDIGKMIAEMHLSTKKISLFRKNSMSIKYLNPLLNSIKFKSKTVILTAGTFINGLMHVGKVQMKGGRIGEPPAYGISEQLAKFGFEVGRMKTGTPPRVDGRSLDYTKMEEQKGLTLYY